MAFNINRFRAHYGFEQGFTSPAHFEINIPSMPGGGIKDLNFLCSHASIPGRSMDFSEFRSYGQPRKFVNSVWRDEDLHLIINVRKGLSERDAFTLWQNAMVDRNTGDVGYYSDYVTEIQLTKYSTSGKVEAKYIFNEAFPSHIGPIELDWNATDRIMTLPITITYRNMYQDYTVVPLPDGNAFTNVSEKINTVAGFI